MAHTRAPVSATVRGIRATLAATLAVVLAAHVGSPNVFYSGRAGPYDVRVEIRPPDVVPGIARVIVRVPPDVDAVTIRPVFWRAGSKGAPPPDSAERARGDATTYTGAIWLMARGAYSVNVAVGGARGAGHVVVPVASVATGRLAMNPLLGALLVVLGIVLCAGLVNIVYKAAGEGLLDPGTELDAVRRARARRVAAIALPALALALLGGARWWRVVDAGYERSMYRPSPLGLTLASDTLTVQMSDTLWQAGNRPSGLLPDHGKLMHLMLARVDDARAFAHLHPVPLDTSLLPDFVTRVPPLPEGEYHVYADVVHETGFERTLVGTLHLGPPDARAHYTAPDSDDAWFVGEASRESTADLGDGMRMELAVVPDGIIEPDRDVTLRIRVLNAAGTALPLDPYMGMAAHAIVLRVDGGVYVHLHPMGTVTTAAQEAFRVRDLGDTNAAGRLAIPGADMRAMPVRDRPTVVEIPYAFPDAGSYRVFVQVRRGGKVRTGAFAVTVAERSEGGAR